MSDARLLAHPQHHVVGALGRFGPIGLAELNAAAELQTRVDRKYVVPTGVACSLLGALSTSMRCLEIGGDRASHYRSLYFDTPDLQSYRSAVTGRRRRFKVRIREYVGSDLRTLEVKTRGRRGLTVKDRLALPEGHRFDSLDPVDVEFVRCLIGAAADHLEPAIRTEYRRSTLLDEAERARVTIDTAVSYGRVGGPTVPLIHGVVVETKSGGRPTAMDRALWASGFRPAKVSKFGVASAVADPTLVANKWSRVLRTYTDWRQRSPDMDSPLSPLWSPTAVVPTGPSFHVQSSSPNF